MYFRCVYSILQRYVFIYKFDQLVGERSAAVFNGRQGGLAGPVAPAAGHSGARGGAIPVALLSLILCCTHESTFWARAQTRMSSGRA